MSKKKETKIVNVAPEPKVSFDVWLAMRKKRIPANHKREIILADFKSRGLSLKETVKTYDAALADYGIVL